MSTHHMLDIAPITEKVLYINEPWLIDSSFDGMEKISEEPDPNACDRGTVLLSHVCDKRTVPLSHSVWALRGKRVI